MSAGTAPGTSVDSHASPSGEWRLWRRPPAPALRAFVAPYQGYEERTPGVARRRHLPAALIPVIVNFGPNLRLLDPQRPDAHYARARAADAEIVREPKDTDYGARVYSARDPEGYLWGFGTYRPEMNGAGATK